MKDKARSITDAALTEDAIKASDYAAVFFAFDGWFSLSLSEFADFLAFGGLQASWSTIARTADDTLAASRDADVRYLMKSPSAMAVYVSKYTTQGLGERAFDARVVLTFAEFPDVDMKLHDGEKMSVSDQAEKMERSGKTRVVGKKLDYFIESARALGKFCPGQVNWIGVPSLQILDNAARFYILAQFAPELFFMRDASDGASVMRNTAEAIRRAPRKRTVRKFSDVLQPKAIGRGDGGGGHPSNHSNRHADQAQVGNVWDLSIPPMPKTTKKPITFPAIPQPQLDMSYDEFKEALTAVSDELDLIPLEELTASEARVFKGRVSHLHKAKSVPTHLYEKKLKKLANKKTLDLVREAQVDSVRQNVLLRAVQSRENIARKLMSTTARTYKDYLAVPLQMDQTSSENFEVTVSAAASRYVPATPSAPAGGNFMPAGSDDDSECEDMDTADPSAETSSLQRELEQLISAAFCDFDFDSELTLNTPAGINHNENTTPEGSEDEFDDPPASILTPIGEDNRGHRLLEKSGWNPNEPLQEPLMGQGRCAGDRSGLGYEGHDEFDTDEFDGSRGYGSRGYRYIKFVSPAGALSVNNAGNATPAGGMSREDVDVEIATLLERRELGLS
ncbi:hypothetical protein HDU87_000006 [Geranomyces variabilis]|uniref:Uncharacterized protein n=1 Tax=Geranomyces variabilis TaxID=109894 RepID=A0AAD5TUQ9_9FUNG|nr:hypothetical protein HDU87_000006 [Geranomyces variabilis]